MEYNNPFVEMDGCMQSPSPLNCANMCVTRFVISDLSLKSGEMLLPFLRKAFNELAECRSNSTIP